MSRRVIERIDLGLIAAILSVASVLATSACSGDSPSGEASVVGGGCSTGDCADPGAACESSAQCASASCVGGQCIAAGGEGGASGSGPSMPSEDSTDGTFILADQDIEQSTGGSAAVCVDLEVNFERVTPTVVLLIDRSGSMTQNFDNGLDRWQTLVQTLTDPQGSLIKKLETSVRFGMALYSSDRGFGNGPTPRQCPVLTNVDISIGNFSNMAAVLGNPANGPNGDTPTAESMAAVAAELTNFAEDGPKSIILATDGDPDTCEDPNANDDDASKAKSVAAVAAAYAKGISTHIISVGDQVTASHLAALAVAGAGGDVTAKAYTALDTAALVGAFNQIIGSVRTCDFTLEGTVEAGDAPRGSVVLDGQPLAYGDANGWVMPDQRTVRLQGSACATVQADASGISMSFPCDAIQIIPR
jgi:von Willebrand factor type A domain